MSRQLYRAFQSTGGSNIQECCSVVELPLNPDSAKTLAIIRVHYSSLNYKDALSASGHKGVTKHYPHVPGIDAVGIVESLPSHDLLDPIDQQALNQVNVGDEVLVMGFDLGMNTAGGFGEYIAVPPSWILKKPSSLSQLETMVLGTAGLTAGMAVDSLIQVGVTPDFGEIAVTGATGGVGSIAIKLLQLLEYSPVAITGKLDEHDYLKALGATQVISREEFLEGATKPILPVRWGGAIDTVGGEMLMTLLKSTQYGGSVTSCGMASSPYFEGNVYPFILRGVNLLGVDTANLPIEIREEIWGNLGASWKISGLDEIVDIVELEQLKGKIEAMLAGKSKGRVVIKVAP